MAHSPARPDPFHPVILFDGVCNLCDAAVRWVIRRDRDQVFRFAALQSEAARGLLEGTRFQDEESRPPDSLVLVDADGVHARSTAVLRVARSLGLPHSAWALALALPRWMRDPAYVWLARRRYRWFGRRDRCERPDPELAGRFLDADEWPAAPPSPEGSPRP